MSNNPYLAHQLAKERINEVLREAKRDRLTQTARGSRNPRRWRLPVVLSFNNLLALFERPLIGRTPSLSKTKSEIGGRVMKREAIK